MEKEQLLLQQNSTSFFFFFFPTSFLSLSEFTRRDDAFAPSVRVCASQPRQSPANPPVPNGVELQARLACMPCIALGAAAHFAVRGFMTCYISAFGEGWVVASSFH